MNRDAPEARDVVCARFREQAAICASLGSPLYSTLLQRAVRDIGAGGPIWNVCRGHHRDPGGSALPLRLMGAVHRLVLDGEAPALASLYPSAGGFLGTNAETWRAFEATVETNQRALRRMILRPVQTNEVGRSAALVGGFLRVAGSTGMPLRLLEIGSSAGLNLRWDRFRYVFTARESWGPARSPVRLLDRFENVPPMRGPCEIADRIGCDTDPIDPTTNEGELTLLSYVWADQTERIELLRGAIAVARRSPALVERASAASWLTRHLKHLRRGVATVVFHSIVWPYLSRPERRRLVAAIDAAAERARRDMPLAWLRMEPAGERAEVRLTLWPPGDERAVATAGYHGRPVRWTET